MTRRADPALYRTAKRLLDAQKDVALALWHVHYETTVYRRRALRLIREAILADRDEQAAWRVREYQRIYARHEAELQRLRDRLKKESE